MILKIYTDGSSRGNPGPGGYGIVMINEDKIKEYGGRDDMTTNNRMEMKAVIEAFKSDYFKQIEKEFSDKKETLEIEVNSDSQYVIKGISEWIFGWMKKGWKNSQKDDVLNRDLWEEMYSLVKDKKIKWNYVKGHAGNKYNERCDEIATAYADKNFINIL